MPAPDKAPVHQAQRKGLQGAAEAVDGQLHAPRLLLKQRRQAAYEHSSRLPTSGVGTVPACFQKSCLALCYPWVFRLMLMHSKGAEAAGLNSQRAG